MKLGIIGSGMIVQEFLPDLAALDGVEILAIQGEKSCWDTVYVAVPNFFHFEYCKKALEKGWNVIVEKPMTSNLKETLFLQKLAQENRCFLFEAITTLYLGNYKRYRNGCRGSDRSRWHRASTASIPAAMTLSRKESSFLHLIPRRQAVP